MRSRTRAWIAALVLLLGHPGLAGVAGSNPLRDWLGELFEPPAVEMREVYERRPDGPTFDHSGLDALLRAHVRAGGWVDYAGLSRDRSRLQAYLDALAAADFEALGRDEKLALLLNAYNAFTLELILDHDRPDSIRDIPRAERWQAERWRVGGRVFSLGQLEHEEIRPKFREPRIHFALVCAAVGCPPLRREAYRGQAIEAQLEDQAREVHDHEAWLAWSTSGKRVRLTEIYDWYEGDFEQVAGSVLEFAARYAPRLRRRLVEGDRPRIEWIDYDWRLNSVANREPR
jgi:hypothetical protein